MYFNFIYFISSFTLDFCLLLDLRILARYDAIFATAGDFDL